MERNLLSPHILEEARARQDALKHEASKYRLLQEIAGQSEQFVLFRKTVLFTGNLLIAVGTWLKYRAAPAPRGNHAPTLAGRVS